MNGETKQFLVGLFEEHVGFVPETDEQLFNDVSSIDNHFILSELCEALNIYVDTNGDNK